MPASKDPVCVFCASSMGVNPIYEAAARSVGAALALSSRKLIYGGGMSGLMGAVAHGALDAGGQVHGIIPRAFVMTGEKGQVRAGEGEREGERKGVIGTTKLGGGESTVVGGMHERKTLMSQLSTGGFITLPGGFGTFEEVMEMTTWSQLGIHSNRPVLLLNIDSFFTPLQQQIQRSVDEGFIAAKNLAFIKFIDGPDDADWGRLAVEALDGWVWDENAGYKGLDWGQA